MSAHAGLLPARGFQGAVRWPLVRIGDVAELHYGKSLPERSRRFGGVQVFGSNGQCGWHDIPLGKGPTVVLGRKGQGPLGVEWCPRPFWVIDTAYYVTVDAKRIDFRYFYYLVKYVGLNHLKDGTSNPGLSRDVFCQQAVPLPSLQAQRSVLNVLIAYDELIENSQRRIILLESMARALYREWFVRGNAPAKELEVELQSGRLDDLCELVKVPFSNALHSDRPLLDLSRMPQHTIAPADLGDSSELTTSRILFESGDTLFGAIRCYLHKVVVAHFSGVTNTSVLVLRPKAANLRALLAIVASDPETIRWAETHSSGTKMPVINWGVFQNMPVANPPSELATRFEENVGPMIDQIAVLASQIQNLRSTRDLLLPRLLSGQIDVAATEAFIEEAVE